jgi:hypothetical protein
VPPPGQFSPGEHERIIQEALDYGVPVAIWVRDLPNAVAPQEICQQLCKLLKDPLDELPNDLHAYRREWVRYNGEVTYLGRVLTLLWDDPRRVPPIHLKNLLSPVVKGGSS